MKNQRGFTLMELLLAIAILAIVTTAALPSLNQFILTNRLSGQANELVTALQFSRSEALKRGVEVRLCSSSDGAACGGDWNQGFIAVADPDDTAEVIRVWGAPGDRVQFAPAAGTIDFGGDGFAAAELDLALQSDYCPTGTENARQITVERSGRVSSGRVGC